MQNLDIVINSSDAINVAWIWALVKLAPLAVSIVVFIALVVLVIYLLRRGPFVLNNLPKVPVPGQDNDE